MSDDMEQLGKLPAGPSSVQELYRWPVAVAQRLLAAADDATEFKRRVTTNSAHLVTTSEFSGMGSAEVALQLGLRGFHTAGRGSGSLQNSCLLFELRSVLRECAA